MIILIIQLSEYAEKINSLNFGLKYEKRASAF